MIDDTELMHAVFSFLSWLNSMHDIALVSLIDPDTCEDTVKPHYELTQEQVRNMIEHYFSNGSEPA